MANKAILQKNIIQFPLLGSQTWE